MIHVPKQGWTSLNRSSFWLNPTAGDFVGFYVIRDC